MTDSLAVGLGLSPTAAFNDASMTARPSSVSQSSGRGYVNKYRTRAPAPGRKPDPGPPGVRLRCTGVHANAAGLYGSEAMKLAAAPLRMRLDGP
jgi:hypothetical protein